jgi:hypothetical protein
VLLEATWVPTIPVPPIMQVGWITSLDFVNRIVPASGEASPQYRIDDSLCNTNPSPLWWYSDGLKHVWCHTTNTFPNGQVVSMDGAGDTSVYRPKLGSFNCPGPRSFMWLAGYRLSYGDRGSGTNGMLWTAVINSDYAGRWAITQKFQARYYVAPGLTDTLNTLNGQAVDAGEYYDGYTHLYSIASTDTHIVKLEDYPSLSCPGISASMLIKSADYYIRFKPGRYENDGNIYATLGIVRWQANGEYSRISGWVTNSTPAASSPEASNDFPAWGEIIVETQ